MLGGSEEQAGWRRWAVSSLWRGRGGGMATEQDGGRVESELEMFLDTEPLLSSRWQGRPGEGFFSGIGDEGGGPPRWKHYSTCMLSATFVIAVAASAFLCLPFVVQMTLDNAQLSFHEINVSFVPASTRTLERVETIALSALVELPRPPMGFSATVTADSGRLLATAEGCFLGSLTIPTLHISAETPAVSQLQTSIAIGSLDCLRAFSQRMLTEANVRASVQGSMSVCVEVWVVAYSLSVCFPDLRVNKTLDLDGMRAFSGAAIQGLDLSHSTRDEVIVSTNILLSNPSMFQISPLGKLGMNVSYRGTHVGSFESVGEWDRIGRGDNVVSLHGSIRPEDPVVAGELFSKFLSGVPTLMDAEIVYSSIPLVFEALSNVKLPAELDPGKALDVLGALALSGINVSPASVGDAALLQALLSVRILSPLGPNSPVSVSGVGMPHGVLLYKSRRTAYLSLPAQAVTTVGDSVTLSVSSVLDVEPEGFAAFLSDFIAQDTVNVTFAGSCDANVTSVLGHLQIHGLNISREIPLVGLGGLHDVDVTDMKFPGVRPDGGLLLDIEAALNNPSDASASLGGISFNVEFPESGGHVIGQVSADVNVRPGKNSLRLQGAIRPVGEEALSAFGLFVGEFLRGEGGMVIGAQGVGCVSKCDEWLEALVKDLRMGVPLPLRPPDTLVTSVGFPGVSLSFDAFGRAVLSGRVSAQYALPFEGVSIGVSRVGMRMALKYGDKPFVNAVLANQPCESDAAAQTISMAVSGMVLDVSDIDTFALFVRELINATAVSVTVQGDASVQAQLSFGSVDVSDVPLRAPLMLAGMGGLSGARVLGFDVPHGAATAQGLDAVLNVSLPNPSGLSLDAGRVSFGIALAGCGTMLGTATLASTRIGPGVNVLGATARLPSGGGACLQHFLSDFVNGKSSNLVMTGLEDKQGVPLVQSALKGFQLSLVAEGMQAALVSRADAYLTDPLVVLETKQIHCEISVSNPLGDAISLIHLDVAVSSMGKAMGQVTHDFSANPIVIPGKRTVRTRAVCVRLGTLANLALIEAFFKAASTSGGAPMTFVGAASARIGGDGGEGAGYDVKLILDQGPVAAFILFKTPPACAP